MPDAGDTPATVHAVVEDETGKVAARLRAPRPDLAMVEALARLQLAARRRGSGLRVRHASEELRELLALAGLADVLGVEPLRKAEPGEQLWVQEVVEPGDPPA